MLYGETGRYPIEITIKYRMISYWLRLIRGNVNKLSFKLFTYMYHLANFESKWLKKIKTILIDAGRNDIWLHRDFLGTTAHTKVNLKQTLLDIYLQNWRAMLQNSHLGTNYSIFKDKIEIEDYLTILGREQSTNLMKFRTANHFFPTVVDGWSGIDYANRLCNLCNSHDIGDEFHMLLSCTFFNNERKLYIDKYFYQRPNIIKYRQLVNIRRPAKLRKLCQFIKLLLGVVRPHT